MRAFFSASASTRARADFSASSASARAICCITSLAEGSNVSGLFVMICSMGQQIQLCLIAHAVDKANRASDDGDVQRREQTEAREHSHEPECQDCENRWRNQTFGFDK